MPAKRKPGPDPLSTYRAKRSLDRTPEPGARPATAGPPPSAGGLFVVHMHAARRLHWDLRLEMDGVLRSWAVPKGPSPNRADKRLAVHVEDHPLEYGDFEGIIPEGNYGAGAVIVWDRGRWVPLEDPVEGMRKGKLLFELQGYKLKGKWTLVKLKKGEKEWLLIKEKDAYVSEDSELPPESVLSGLTVEELKAGKDRAAPVLKALARLTAPRRAVTVAEAGPMLAETRGQPVSKTRGVFDLLAFEGYDLRPLPLEQRKALLEQIVPRVGPLKYLSHFEKDGEALYEQVVKMGLEGIVAKKADAPYRAGRSPNWLKIRAAGPDGLVGGGSPRPKGSRSGFGALDLGAYQAGKLVYAGRAGSGFTDTELKDVTATLERGIRETPAFTGPVPPDAGHTWVEPTLIAEVRYKEWTDEGLLRQPVFVRFRDDKPITEAAKKGAGSGERDLELPPESTAPRSPLPREVKFSNLEKVFWPDEGFTKGDLIEYHRAVSPWLLPYLKDRPVVLTRYPDGITGKSFFQKDAPSFVPDWIRLERIWSEDTQRDIAYFLCDNVESLLYIINMGTIPLHVWGSRIETLEQPDWCILDLDPKEAPFVHVIKVARATKQLCDDIGLPCFIKTSGSTGLHVLIPVGRQCTYEQVRTLGGLLARVIAAELPDIATITRQVEKRGAKVYIDYVQNGHGRLLVAPFSAQPLPGAPVSMPLQWSEVTPKLDIKKFTIKTAPARMKRLEEDPLRPVLELKPDLVATLERSEERRVGKECR